MYRRRTAGGRYVPARSSRAELFEEALDAASARRRPASSHRRPPRRGSASPASMPPTGRHACRCGRYSAWKRRPGCRLAATPESALQLAHFVDGLASTGVVGTGLAGHALALTCSADVAHRRDPSLRAALFVARPSSLLRSPRTPAAPRSLSPLAYTSRACPDDGLRRRASRVPFRLRVTRAAPPTPPRPAARTPPDWGAADVAFAVT